MTLAQEGLPVIGNGAEVHCLDIAVADGDSGAGVPPVLPGVGGRRDACPTTREAIPHPLSGNGRRFCLDLTDQVAAELAARGLGEPFDTAQRELARTDQAAYLLEDPRLTLDGQRGDVEIGIGADE